MRGNLHCLGVPDAQRRELERGELEPGDITGNDLGKR
jgi:hypothetical protein